MHNSTPAKGQNFAPMCLPPVSFTFTATQAITSKEKQRQGFICKEYHKYDPNTLHISLKAFCHELCKLKCICDTRSIKGVVNAFANSHCLRCAPGGVRYSILCSVLTIFGRMKMSLDGRFKP